MDITIPYGEEWIFCTNCGDGVSCGCTGTVYEFKQGSILSFGFWHAQGVTFRVYRNNVLMTVGSGGLIYDRFFNTQTGRTGSFYYFDFELTDDEVFRFVLSGGAEKCTGDEHGDGCGEYMDDCTCIPRRYCSECELPQFVCICVICECPENCRVGECPESSSRRFNLSFEGSHSGVELTDILAPDRGGARIDNGGFIVAGEKIQLDFEITALFLGGVPTITVYVNGVEAGTAVSTGRFTQSFEFTAGDDATGVEVVIKIG
jgi:hypothetical protein